MSSDTTTVVHRDDFVRLGRAWGDIVDTMFSVSFAISSWSTLRNNSTHFRAKKMW